MGQEEKVILNNVSGFGEFGCLTGVMGPSGAGLTSLLMRLGAETRIRLSRDHKIRSTFIGHNEKDFLIMGLTAKQNMIYASRLKNSDLGPEGQAFDHQMNVSAIMADLLMSDTMNTRADRCSGGEQKRLAIAVELTAFHKPNLILFDEPTTGLDSNVAEVVIQCIKSLAQKHNICIIATIHQPNSDVLQMFDNLYVLAKGGQCVYFGPPVHLRHHLSSSNIVCNENQVPIEHLLTIASKGMEDTDVIQLRERTIQS
ncbi:unnamed protein product, partial [Medioppia subpectinata]